MYVLYVSALHFADGPCVVSLGQSMTCVSFYEHAGEKGVVVLMSY